METLRRIWQGIRYQITIQDIVISILILLIMLWVFSGCSVNTEQSHKPKNIKYELVTNDCIRIYEIVDPDSCRFIMCGDALVHSYTCDNPNHTHVKVIEEFE